MAYLISPSFDLSLTTPLLYYSLLTEADATQLPVEHNTTGDSSHLCNGYQYNNSSSTADMIVRKKPLQDSNLHLKTERVFTKESTGDWNPVDWRPTQISDDLVITEEIILKELESLNITKSMGPDNLNPRVLHETRQQINSHIDQNSHGILAVWRTSPRLETCQYFCHSQES